MQVHRRRERKTVTVVISLGANAAGGEGVAVGDVVNADRHGEVLGGRSQRRS
jgi:hypothetical protein